MPALEKKLAAGTAVVAVIGLGTVGLPTALALAATGVNVIALDRSFDRVTALRAGRPELAQTEPGLEDLLRVAKSNLHPTTDPAALQQVDIVIVAVETPVDAVGVPSWEPLDSALHTILEFGSKAKLVIVESTLAPGTMDARVVPRFAGRPEVGLAHCPERVMPGKLLANLRTMPRLCGVDSPQAGRDTRALYTRIVDAEISLVDLVTAELVKSAENAYRDVQIAFANAVALACEAHGAHFPDVRAHINAVPGRAMLEAGAGVGGACIPKDTHLLANTFEAPPLLRAARTTNDAMPIHMASLVKRALRAHGRELSAATIIVLGTGYLRDHGDERGSPGLALGALLDAAGAHVHLHDPHAKGRNVALETVAEGADALVLTTAHAFYTDTVLSPLAAKMRTPLIVDGRFALDADHATKLGYSYVGLGRPFPRARNVRG